MQHNGIKTHSARSSFHSQRWNKWLIRCSTRSKNIFKPHPPVFVLSKMQVSLTCLTDSGSVESSTPYHSWKRKTHASPFIRHLSIPTSLLPTSICPLSPQNSPVMSVRFQSPKEYFCVTRFTFSPFTPMPFPPRQDRKTLWHSSRFNRLTLLLPSLLSHSSTHPKHSISVPSAARTLTTPIWVAAQPTATLLPITSKARRSSTCLRRPVASATTRVTQTHRRFHDPPPQHFVACR